MPSLATKWLNDTLIRSAKVSDGQDKISRILTTPEKKYTKPKKLADPTQRALKKMIKTDQNPRPSNNYLADKLMDEANREDSVDQLEHVQSINVAILNNNGAELERLTGRKVKNSTQPELLDEILEPLDEDYEEYEDDEGDEVFVDMDDEAEVQQEMTYATGPSRIVNQEQNEQEEEDDPDEEFGDEIEQDIAEQSSDESDSGNPSVYERTAINDNEVGDSEEVLTEEEDEPPSPRVTKKLGKSTTTKKLKSRPAESEESEEEATEQESEQEEDEREQKGGKIKKTKRVAARKGLPRKKIPSKADVGKKMKKTEGTGIDKNGFKRTYMRQNVPFGNWLLCKNRLDAGILAPRYGGGGPIAGFGNKNVSEHFISNIKHIMKYNKISPTKRKALKPQERGLLDELLRRVHHPAGGAKAKIGGNDGKKFKNKAHYKPAELSSEGEPSEGSEESEPEETYQRGGSIKHQIKHYDIVKGMIDDGNDNPKELKKLGKIALELKSRELMTGKQYAALQRKYGF